MTCSDRIDVVAVNAYLEPSLGPRDNGSVLARGRRVRTVRPEGPALFSVVVPLTCVGIDVVVDPPRSNPARGGLRHLPITPDSPHAGRRRNGSLAAHAASHGAAHAGRAKQE